MLCGPMGECGWVIAQMTRAMVAVLVSAARTVRIAGPVLSASAPAANAASQAAASGSSTAAGSACSEVAKTPALATMARATGRRRGAGMAARGRELEVRAVAFMI
jgi:hypothetical protein